MGNGCNYYLHKTLQNQYELYNYYIKIKNKLRNFSFDKTNSIFRKLTLMSNFSSISTTYNHYELYKISMTVIGYVILKKEEERERERNDLNYIDDSVESDEGNEEANK